MPPKLLANIHRLPDGPYFGAWSVFEIRTAFQPLFRFRGGKVEIGAYECLVRPFRNGEAISPGNFFPMIPHQDKVEVESLMRFVHLMNAGAFLDPASLVFVNFDPSLFVERILVEKALDDLLFDFVQALRRQGYRIAVDDYGSDDSDMERIRRLKPDIIMFDAHWIMRLMDSNAGYALLESMVHRFRDERITTVFEGIEEHWQLELAERAGADFVQGFVLARPELAPGNFSQFRAAATLDPPTFRPSQPVSAPNRAAKTFGRRTSL